MKRILVTLFILFIASHYFYSINAQNKEDKKKQKKIVIKIAKEENGKITKVDTTIILKEGEDPSVVLEKYGLKGREIRKNAGTYDIKVEVDDSGKGSTHKKVVYVTINDDDSTKQKVHKTHMVMITDDGDDEVMHMNNGNVMIIKEKTGKHGHGDSMIWEEKVIVGSPDKKQKKVYKFKHQNMDSEDNVFLFSEGNHGEMNHMMMSEMEDDSDSTIIVTKKYKGGKEISDTKKVIRHEKKEKKVLLKVVDAEKADLAKLKLKENYKKLEVNNFTINFINEKMSLNFDIKDKANTSIKLIDKDGKTTFHEALKQFSGKYSKEMDALLGEFYIQVNQGNNFNIRKVIIDIK